MTDTIVQEVRDIRASIAEAFGYDRARYLAWAREETKRNAGSLSQVPQLISIPEDKVLADAVPQS